MRPIEWLDQLTERPDGYRSLLNDAGDLLVAAWRLARARCQVLSTSTSVPTGLEVKAAARELSERLGLGVTLPSSRALALECEAHGLMVI